MGEVDGSLLVALPEEWRGNKLSDSLYSGFTYPTLEAIEPDCAAWFNKASQPKRRSERRELGREERTPLLRVREPEPISIIDLQITRERLNDLLDEEEDEDYLLPTDYALSKARHFIDAAYNKSGEHFRRAAVASDGEGGIRIYWRNQIKNIDLIIPANPDQGAYLYYKDRDESGIYELESETTEHSIADWLAWLSA